MDEIPSGFDEIHRPVSARTVALANALAGRLCAVAPAGILVTADRGNVNVSSNGRSLHGSAASSIIDDDDDRTIEEKIETVVRAVLSGVQDCIAELLTEQWPAASDDVMALPGARIENNRAHLWFGDEKDPTLSFTPLDLTEIYRTT
ncbi:MAG TPA: hypothetical protein VIM15_05275 [Gemmatimonadaceae bacterium]|jgi:hypothetical protein